MSVIPQQLTEDLKYISELDVDELPSASVLGVTNFEESKEIIEILKKMCASVSYEVLKYIDQNALNNFTNHLNSLRQAIEVIVDFNTDSRPNLSQDIINYNDQLAARFHQFNEHFLQIGNLSRYYSGADPLAKSLKDAKKIVDRLVDFESSAKTSLGKIGISQEAGHYKIEATIHKWLSVVWLLGLGVLLSILTLYLNHLYIGLSDPFPEQLISENLHYYLIRSFATKFFIAGTIFYGAYFCSRHFSANLHNYVLNKQRMRALMSYDSLVKSSNFDSAKEILLGYVASCIYSPRDSGFSNHKNQESAHPALDFFKNLYKT